VAAEIIRIDFERRLKWGESSTLKLFEKADGGLQLTQTLTAGWFIGRVYDRFKGELVDKLLIDSSAGVDPAKLLRASGVDAIRVEGETSKTFRYSFASGKPESLDFNHFYSIELRANFGDATAYVAGP
jgi:hypothetical protein